MIVKVKPQAKKAKLDHEGGEDPSKTRKSPGVGTEKSLNGLDEHNGVTDIPSVVKTGLVSYSDESEEDD